MQPPGRLSHHRPSFPSWRSAVAARAAAVLLAGGLLASCRSPRKEFLAHVSPPQPLLTGTATYGSGAVSVQAWLGPSVRLRSGEGRRSGRSGDAEGRGAPAPGRGGGRHQHPFAEGGSFYSREEMDQMYGRRDEEFLAMPARLALTLTFTNTGSAPVTFSVANLDSTLGNFATRPETFTLAPGQQASPDPMLSPVENNFDLLDVTLTLKQTGPPETHVIALRPADAGARPPQASQAPVTGSAN